jgi:hypothetical protein
MKLFFIIILIFINCLSMQRDKDILVHTFLKLDRNVSCDQDISLQACLLRIRAEEMIFIMVNKIDLGENIVIQEKGCNEFIFLKFLSGNYLKLNRCKLESEIEGSYENITLEEIIVFHSVETDFEINPILEFYNIVIASFWAVPAPWYYHHSFKGKLSVVKIEELVKHLEGVD